jgi:hypothetical protein
MSSEHFSVDGTLLEAWASVKSFRPKGEAQAPGRAMRSPETAGRGRGRGHGRGAGR